MPASASARIAPGRIATTRGSWAARPATLAFALAREAVRADIAKGGLHRVGLSGAVLALGTLCVIDREVREADRNKLETLRFLAAEVIQRMEARRAARRAGGAD